MVPGPFEVEDRNAPDDINDMKAPSSDVLPQEGETLHEQEDGVECTMTVAATEGEMDEDLASRIVEQYGEYDPTLDLPGYEFRR